MAWWCCCCRSPSHNEPWLEKINSLAELPKCVDAFFGRSANTRVLQRGWPTKHTLARPHSLSYINLTLGKVKERLINWFGQIQVTIGHDLCLYRQQDIALWLILVQIFPKQIKSQTLLGLYLFWKNWILRYPKPDNPVLRYQLLAWISSILAPWYLLVLFHVSKYLGSLNLWI
jgi:hypothetical protein